MQNVGFINFQILITDTSTSLN